MPHLIYTYSIIHATLFDIIGFPIVIALGVYVAQRIFPHFLFAYEEPKREISWQTLWLIIALWFSLLIASYYLIRPANIAIHLSQSFWWNITTNRKAIAVHLSDLILDALFIAYCIKRFSLSWREIGFRWTNPYRLAFWTLAASYDVLGTYLYMALGKQPTYYSGPNLHIFWLATVVNGIELVILGPLLEEIVFRGVFFTLLRSRMSPYWAWIFQAALFSVSHMFIQNPIGAMGPGLVFGFGAIGAGSIFPGIFAHMLFNTTGNFYQAAEVMKHIH